MIDENMLKLFGFTSDPCGNISMGVCIENEMIEFEEKWFYNNSIGIMLPVEDTVMPSSMAKMKYPSEQRPEIILTNSKRDADFCLNRSEKFPKNSEIIKGLFFYSRLIQKVHPTVIFEDSQVENYADKTMGWFAYISDALDGKIYNMLFLTVIERYFYIGNFNCRNSIRKEWKPYMLQMMRSIKGAGSAHTR